MSCAALFFLQLQKNVSTADVVRDVSGLVFCGANSNFRFSCSASKWKPPALTNVLSAFTLLTRYFKEDTLDISSASSDSGYKKRLVNLSLKYYNFFRRIPADFYLVHARKNISVRVTGSLSPLCVCASSIAAQWYENVCRIDSDRSSTAMLLSFPDSSFLDFYTSSGHRPADILVAPFWF